MSGKGRIASWVTVGAKRPKQNTMTAIGGMIVNKRTGPIQATARAQPELTTIRAKQTAMMRRDGTCAVLRRALTREPRIRLKEVTPNTIENTWSERPMLLINTVGEREHAKSWGDHAAAAVALASFAGRKPG